MWLGPDVELLFHCDTMVRFRQNEFVGVIQQEESIHTTRPGFPAPLGYPKVRDDFFVLKAGQYAKEFLARWRVTRDVSQTVWELGVRPAEYPQEIIKVHVPLDARPKIEWGLMERNGATSTAMPVVDVYACCYNEEALLPYFLKHYDFARRIVLYDNHSTDRTAAIAKANPKVVWRTFYTGGKYDESAQTNIRNSAWRESDADYVAVVDVDEFVDCRPLIGYGRREVAFKCEGRDMVGEDGQIPPEVKRYMLSPGYDKISVFSPRIAGINYDHGMHVVHPTCPVVIEPRLVLRHYCRMGEQWTINRYRQRSMRMSDAALDAKWGFQYLYDDETILKEHRKAMSESLEET